MRQLRALFAPAGGWNSDRLAVGLSALCILHCLGTALALLALSSLGDLLAAPIIHETGLLVAALLGVISVVRGFKLHGLVLPALVGAGGIGAMAGALALGHGTGEILLTVAGASLLAFGHELNRRAIG